MLILDRPAPQTDAEASVLKAERRRVAKQRGIALASGGLGFALAALLGIKLLGFATLSFRAWLLAVALTAAVQLILWLIPRRGWDARLAWDRHYLIVPMLAAAALLCLYAWLVPEARALVLVGWVVGLIFMAGLAGFMQVAALSVAMTAGYLAVVGALWARGEPVSIGLEALLACTFLLISVFAGLMFERLRRERLEMRRLREELRVLASTDALTGLPNRRRFEEFLRAELERVGRYGGRCGVAILDVDFFKNYNDALGHLAGDGVLRDLAALMRRHTRVNDIVARYGGEEFAIIMVNAPRDEVIHAVDRLRAIVQSHPFPDEHVQPGGQLTLSAGIASCPDDASDFDGLLKKADDALYTAKREGRNRVHAATALA